MNVHARVAAGLVIALIVAGCGGAGGSGGPSAVPSMPASGSAGPTASGSAASGTVFPVIVSSELVVGPNRVLFSFLDATGTTPIAAPDRTASVSFSGPGGEAIPAATGTFIWAIEGTSGLYVTRVAFPVAGAWTAQFTTGAPGSPETTVPFGFDVRADARVVVPGEAAPSVDTPTLADVGGDVAKLSTDDEPDRTFYETSVADALTAGTPFVLVFATPQFCQTQTCGPTLDKVKAVAAKHPDMTFINIEPYQTTFTDGRLQPVLSADNLLQTVPASDAFGLVTEPYVFVVGGDGKVAASFELIFTPEEMDAAIEALSQD